MINWKAFLAGAGLPIGLTFYVKGNLPVALLMLAASAGLLVVVYYEHIGKFKFRGFK